MNFSDYRSGLIGKTVSHTWRGHGEAIFLELGKLTPSERTYRDGSPGNPDGELGIMIEWGFRLENDREILWGSSSEETVWEQGLAAMLGLEISDASLSGRLPELTIDFTNGQRLLTFMVAEGQPEWTIFDRRKGSLRWLHVEDGTLQETINDANA